MMGLDFAAVFKRDRQRADGLVYGAEGDYQSAPNFAENLAILFMDIGPAGYAAGKIWLAQQVNPSNHAFSRLKIGFAKAVEAP
jgi:hypothetical protein